MSRKTDLAIKELMMNNYGHYSRQYEKELLRRLMLGKEEEISFDIMNNDETFDYQLGPDPLRSIKNGLICLVAIICREAVDLGADNTKSFALSDYMINRIEYETRMDTVSMIISDIIFSYRKLVREGRDRGYSRPVKNAVSFISDHIYESVSLKDVAGAVGLSGAYLSSAFKKETGETVSGFIKRVKIEEARSLLSEKGLSVSEVSDLLGYSSVSYFSKVYSEVCGYSPSREASPK